MTESPQTQPGAHIRGAAAGPVSAGRVLTVLALAAAVVLGAVTIALAVGGAGQRSSSSALRAAGVQVQATVTGCRSISSGIGMGIEYWQCAVSYQLDGRHDGETLRGSRHLLQAGQPVEVVAVPGRPSLVTLATAVGRPVDWWGAYWPAVLTAVLALACAAIAGRRLSGRAP